MSITYPITLPALPAARSIEFSMMDNVAVVPSEFTLQQQVQDWQAGLWMVKVTIAPGKRSEMEPWLAALAIARGRLGTFYLGDPGGATPRGVATGTPLVNGAGQIGYTLAIDGFTPGVTGIIKAGDYLQVGSGATQRLHKFLTDLNSNGSGQVLADIWPRLRESPADNAPITLVNTAGVFRLADNVRTWSYDASRFYQVSFNAIEAI